MRTFTSKSVKDLVKALLSLKNPDEAERFLRDLLTIGEIDEFARRLQMARMIQDGIPYLDIANKLKVSTTTVSRVALWLKHGRGGYALILHRLYPKKKA